MSAVDPGAFPAVADIEAIAAIANPVLRNLRITECYADLAAAMRSRTGGAADWCTFATWASRQAGSTIRGEDFLDALDRVLGRHSWLLAPVQSVSRVLLRKGLFQPDTRLGRVVAEIHTPFDAFERASAHVAEGNLKVFAEIGREFARFLATVPVEGSEDSPAFSAFAAGLRRGAPPQGQDLLREAFAHYQQQPREADAGPRAAWLLLANLKIGLHEQTRLQPQIAEAVSAPLVTAEDLGARVLHALIPGSRHWRAVAHDPLAKAIGWVAARVRRDAVKATQEVVTEALMVLAIPGGTGGAYLSLALGRDLMAPVPQGLSGTHDFLDGFVKVYDPCPPGGTRCAAQDWCDINQRMHYIVHLFRAYSETPALFSRPFTPGQVSSFRDGVIPEGDL